MDRIKLLIERKIDRDYIAENDSPSVKIVGRNKYQLFNRFEDHSLKMYKSNDGTIIDGSFRKWHYGCKSLLDLTPTLLIKTIEEISSLTGFKIDEILNAKILIIEFGMNVKLSVIPGAFLRNIYRYSSLELGRYDTSLSFQGYNYWFCLYDKITEMKRKNSDLRAAKIFTDENILRVEIKAFRRSAIESKLRGVANLRDVIKKYRMMHVSLFKEIKRIEMKPLNLKLDNVSFYGKKTADLKKYWELRAIYATGVRTSFEYIRQLDVHKGVKTRHRNRIRELFKGFENGSHYCMRNFLVEVKQGIIKNINLPIPKLA